MVPKKPLSKLLLGYNATKVYSKGRIQLFGNLPWAKGAMVQVMNDEAGGLEV